MKKIPLHEEYGENDLTSLIVCGRCADAVPAFVRTITVEDRFTKTVKEEIHCLRCKKNGHEDGTYITDLPER